jgi:hypothetical protein
VGWFVAGVEAEGAAGGVGWVVCGSDDDFFPHPELHINTSASIRAELPRIDSWFVNFIIAFQTAGCEFLKFQRAKSPSRHPRPPQIKNSMG